MEYSIENASEYIIRNNINKNTNHQIISKIKKHKQHAQIITTNHHLPNPHPNPKPTLSLSPLHHLVPTTSRTIDTGIIVTVDTSTCNTVYSYTNEDYLH